MFLILRKICLFRPDACHFILKPIGLKDSYCSIHLFNKIIVLSIVLIV